MEHGGKPLVSVVVQTYNQEQYIAECLDGILSQQTDFPIEVIVFDDASTDATPQIVRRYAEQYPELIRPVFMTENQWSRGFDAFFTEMLPLLRGKYWAGCDGDDYWTYPHKLQRQADFLESHTDYVMCLHCFRDRSEVPGFQRFTPSLRRSRRLGVMELAVNPLAQWSTVMGRIDTVRSDASLLADAASGEYKWMDIRMYLAYLNAGRVYGFRGRWSVYRIQPRGIYMSLQLKNDAEDAYVHILSMIEERYGGRFKGLRRKRRRLLHLRAMLDEWTYARRKGKYLKAVGELARALAAHPALFFQTYYHRYIR